MKRFFLMLFCCVWAVKAEAKLMNLSSFTLGNGLDVAVIENHKAPVILQMLYYKTGAVNDPKGKAGIAHLLEHMMFRGTKHVPDKEFNRLTDEHGAENNAYTTYKETGYYEFTDISKLELMMALEADRMRHLELNDEAFKTERDIVLQERMQRYENNPVTLFYETMNKILWQGHPLANPVSGSVEEITALTKDDAQAFYDLWYRPDNALLVLSGDISPEEAKVLVQKYYGHLSNGGDKPQMTLQAGRPAKTSLTMKIKGVEQPRFVSFFRMEKAQFSKEEVAALELLAEYLSGNDTAYLYDKLVYQERALLSIDVGVSYDRDMGGVFAFYAVPTNDDLGVEKIADKIKIATAEAMRALTTEKLQSVKNRVLSGTVYMQENPESAARFVGNMLLAGYTAEEIMAYDAQIKAIRVEDLLAVWQKVAAAEIQLTGYLAGE